MTARENVGMCVCTPTFNEIRRAKGGINIYEKKDTGEASDLKKRSRIR